MPFQSEKQRRYLHANHPEIAKRWERDYANGGITLPKGPAGITSLNGWGSTDSSQNKAGADISASMDRNPNDPGWGGGGGENNDNKPPLVNIHKGPTAEEIAAAKAKAEAEKRRLEAEARQKNLTNFKKTQKKKTDWVQKGIDTVDSGMKLKNFATSLNPLDLMKTNPKLLGLQLIYNQIKKNKENKDKDKVFSLNVDTPMQVAELTDMQKKMLGGPQKNLKEIMGLSNEEILKNIEKFNDPDNPATIEDVNTFYSAKGGVARKKYSTGTDYKGVLSLEDEESEDISLTAFNPKFDDIPQLTDEEQLQIDSEEKEDGEKRIDLFAETDESDPLNELLLAEDGVTTLFRAKNGGYAVQGGVKNYLGEQEMVHAPKHWQSAPDHPETELTYITKPEKNLLVKADLHGSLHGNVNKGPQGITSLNGWGDADDGFGSSGDTSDGGWGNDPQGEFGGIDSGGWDPGVFSPGTTPSGENVNTSPNVTTISGGDIWDWDDTSEIDDVYETFQNVKHRYDKNKTTQGWKMVINMLTGNLGGIVSTGYGMHKDKKAYEEMLNKLKQDAIDLGIPEYNPHTDTLIQTIDQEVIDINTKQDTEPQESDGPEPVAPVIKELTEYEQMAWDPMSYLDKIRAGQAQRAALQAKGIIQDNEIMTLNSGGLANLFTVKNYN